MARSLGRHLDRRVDHRAAVALAALHGQAVETLFAWLGAAAQAPAAPSAWLLECRSHELRSLVSKINTGTPIYCRVRRPDDTSPQVSTTWDCLARWTLARGGWPGDDDTPKQFAAFWRRLAREFLDEGARAEFNAIKHGFRAIPGGHTIQAGEEPTPGAPCPPEHMREIPGSPYGATTPGKLPINGLPKNHFQLIEVSRNWTPESIALRVCLIGMSLNNLRSTLLIAHGEAPESQRFARPADPAAFTECWRASPLRTSSFRSEVDPADAAPMTDDQIRASYGHG